MPDIKDISVKKSTPYKVKSFALKAEDVDLTKKTVTGFYNSFYFFDSDADVLLPGCSLKSIRERGPLSTAVPKIKHLLHHDWTKSPGPIKELDEKKVQQIQGIWFASKMIDTAEGRDTLINYQEGVYDNHSIGFRYLDGEFVDNDSENWKMYLDMLINPEAAEKFGYMFVWKEIQFFEGSTVMFGANSLTPYLGVKSGNKDLLKMQVVDKIELLEKQLRGGTQTDEMMHQFAMQTAQLKQYISEMFDTEPDIKDTLKNEGRKNKSTGGDAELIDLTTLPNFKL
ncbi:MAG: HK97 family phage prohead protease [Flavihumibacter sp.]|nr:HK97 family phage prohead protease [Flavihumibacter sp.]